MKLNLDYQLTPRQCLDLIKGLEGRLSRYERSALVRGYRGVSAVYLRDLYQGSGTGCLEESAGLLERRGYDWLAEKFRQMREWKLEEKAAATAAATEPRQAIPLEFSAAYIKDAQSGVVRMIQNEELETIVDGGKRVYYAHNSAGVGGTQYALMVGKTAYPLDQRAFKTVATAESPLELATKLKQSLGQGEVAVIHQKVNEDPFFRAEITRKKGSMKEALNQALLGYR
ncbi:hypothetical protein HYY74_05910 [Candidatus Woesearchaeota archaeon]|nr:hypothetical protein [Candidatus Woesearchaeota archaeon]